MRCPGCSIERDHALVETHGTYTIHHCRECDLVFCDPMESPGQSWYENHPEYSFRDTMKAGDLRWNHRQFLVDRPAPGSDLLDVGCGPGAFLREARSVGYRVAGLDFDRRAIEVARQRFNLWDVHALSLGQFAETFPERRFDIITFFEVLEHQANPVSFLEDVKRLLKPQGLIALSVPFRDRMPATRFSWDYPPHHLTRWNEAAMANILARAGFSVRTIRVGWLAGANILRERLGTARVTNALSAGGHSGVVDQMKSAVGTVTVNAGSLAIRTAGRVVDAGVWLGGATGIDMYVVADLDGLRSGSASRHEVNAGQDRRS